MQSGISASRELQDAFNNLVSSPTQRALLVTIENETLVPKTTLPLHSPTFKDDLSHLQSHLTPTTALYILLKLDPAAPDGYTAITYIPNAAPVRQKMLFASTRLTLVRDLGIERFRSTLFATDPADLTASGWAKHEQHEGLAAPLTAEEAGLADVKAAEAQESQGTGARRGHVSSKVNVPTGDGVLDALASLKEEGCRGTLVQLKFQLPDETLQLESSTDSVAPGEVAGLISSEEPRYTFYSLPGDGAGEARILFVYTCPTGSKIKERMVYSTSKSWTRVVAERDAGIVIARSLEATEPGDVTAGMLGEGGEGGEEQAAATEVKPSTGFARPKRPGRR